LGRCLTCAGVPADLRRQPGVIGRRADGGRGGGPGGRPRAGGVRGGLGQLGHEEEGAGQADNALCRGVCDACACVCVCKRERERTSMRACVCCMCVCVCVCCMCVCLWNVRLALRAMEGCGIKGIEKWRMAYSRGEACSLHTDPCRVHPAGLDVAASTEPGGASSKTRETGSDGVLPSAWWVATACAVGR